MYIINYLRAHIFFATLIFFALMSLRAQSDDATLINITTLEQLDAIRYDLDGNGVPIGTGSEQATYRTAFGLTGMNNNICTGGCRGYELMNNLDFEDANGDGTAGDLSIWAKGAGAAGVSGAVAEGWALIGYYNSSSDKAPYTATFDGRGHTISNLYINRPSTSYVGLFGLLGTLLGTGGNVRNLGIEGGSLSGSDFVGGLVGANFGGTISACYATGNATGTGNNVGGLVGNNFPSGTISACYATGDATGAGNVGGLVGNNFPSGTISACYATGNATGTGNNVGGLVGNNDSGTISACYATGNVSGSDFVGGLVGNNDSGTIRACYATGDATGFRSVGGLVGANFGGTISACYATGDASGSGFVGGLVGNNFGAITDSYFDSDTSNRTDSDDYAKTTTQLQTPTAYAGIYSNWNIDVDNGLDVGVDNGTEMGDATADNPWDFGTNSEYPALRVDFDRSGTSSVAEFGTQPRTALLRVSSFTPERGVVGTTVTIRGKFFSTTAGENTVTFLGAEGDDTDNVEATVSTSPAPTAASLTVTAPPDAQTGPISVMVGTAADTSSQDFTVLIAEDKDENDNGLIEVSSLEQLDAIHYDLDGDGIPSGTDLEQTAYRTAFGLSGVATAASCTGGCKGYELMNNLDFEDANGDGTADDKSIWAEGATAAGVSGVVAEGWAPLGYFDNTYTATFDGRGHTISNLYIDRPSTGNVGLFGALGTGSNVRNLGIEGGSVTGYEYVGGLVGFSFGTISACYATGNASGNNLVGGLVGFNRGTISACYATGNASGTTNVGGLVGENTGGISACYATGNTSGARSVGGLVGSNEGISPNNSTISTCYARGSVSGSSHVVGGLVGSNTGDASSDGIGIITNSYFDINTSSQTIAIGTETGETSVSNTEGKSTADLLTPTTYGTGMDIYANWNIDVDDGLDVGVDNGTAVGDSDTDNPWDFGTNMQYPALRVDFNVNGTPTALEFGGQGRAAAPVVSSFSPTEGAVDTEVTISGQNFSTTAAENTVTFLGAEGDADNAAATVSAATAISLTVSVPSTAQTGKISVMVGSAADTSAASFTVTPVVSSFTPTSGVVGTTVTITGTDFSTTAADNTVTFLGVEGDVADNVMATVSTSPAPTTTQLTVSVPPDAKTGKISVMVGTAVDTSDASFAVTGTTPVSPFSVPLPSEGDVRVYPNPTLGQLHFKGLLAGGRYVCDLYSLVGQKVLSSVVRAGDMMDISTLSSAQYILILQAEGRELMRTRLLVLE